MHNADYTDADLRLNFRLVDVWGAAEKPMRAWLNADTGEVVELLEDLGDADLLIDDPDLLADLLLD